MDPIAPPTLSSSGEDAIARCIQVSPDTYSEGRVEEAYEIDWTVAQLHVGNYQRIALQFPDELLHVSVPIYRAIKAKVGAKQEVYILADTTYGSCCVDEVAAQHVDADVIVHYGHACLSPTSRLPVIYVFGRRPLDPIHCVATLLHTSQLQTKQCPAVLLLYDVAYCYQAGMLLCQHAITRELEVACDAATKIIAPQITRVAGPGQSNSRLVNDIVPVSSSLNSPSSRRSPFPPDVDPAGCVILYVGSEGLALTNILMTHSNNEVWSYDPSTREARLESRKSNRLLMRRYAIVQKARDADVFGILIGTLGVAQYLPMINQVRGLLKRARKKAYTISVGKLNPSKLANFMEVECYVLIACPENSIIDSKDFLRPIITPFELEIALGDEVRWTGEYLLDFEQVLLRTEGGAPGDLRDDKESDEDSDNPIFSLATGRYRQAKRFVDRTDGTTGSEESTAVILPSKESTVAKFMGSAGGEFLQKRTFQGLEQRLGRDAPSVLEQGRTGIARGYNELESTKLDG